MYGHWTDYNTDGNWDCCSFYCYYQCQALAKDPTLKNLFIGADKSLPSADEMLLSVVIVKEDF